MWVYKLVGTAAAIFLVAGLASAGQGSSPCRGSSGSSARMLSGYRWIAVLNDSVSNAYRQSIGLSAIDSNQVVLVSDTTTCRAALNAYNAELLPDTVQSSSVSVVKYGTTRYVVADSARISGEWVPNVVFNSLFSQVIAKVGQ